MVVPDYKGLFKASTKIYHTLNISPERIMKDPETEKIIRGCNGVFDIFNVYPETEIFLKIFGYIENGVGSLPEGKSRLCLEENTKKASIALEKFKEGTYSKKDVHILTELFGYVAGRAKWCHQKRERLEEKQKN